jgi:hypothetical protein
MENESAVPAYLHDTYQMLKCAYPSGVPESDYIPLLAIVHEYMSFWTIADVLSVLTGKDRSLIYNDASGYGIDDPFYDFTQDDIDRVKARLVPYGFEQWVKSGDQ